jgi:transposase InsO family protein
VPRSSFYAQLASDRLPTVAPAPPAKRGPKTKLTDDALLALIRADLAASPFQGEGHRKVWARLKVQKGVRTSRKRVLRIMRENKLLSPHRNRRGLGVVHDGTIITDAPGIMWGTDGTRVFTVENGWCWIFVAVEHWNAECVGWHVCKTGSRFAALEPLAAGLTRLYGSVGADSARGLQLRMDNGTQYLADHFLKQIRYWGIQASFAFIEQPQTNGVAERFNRTLKEQVVHGRIFQNLEQLRAAVAAFVELYNEHWRIEKLGFLTPTEARLHYARGVAA